MARVEVSRLPVCIWNPATRPVACQLATSRSACLPNHAQLHLSAELLSFTLPAPLFFPTPTPTPPPLPPFLHSSLKPSIIFLQFHL